MLSVKRLRLARIVSVHAASQVSVVDVAAILEILYGNLAEAELFKPIHDFAC